MTKKELAKELYWLYVKKGICNIRRCGEEEWVRRTLNGCGACRPASKAQLEQAIIWAKEDLKILAQNANDYK